MGNIKTQAGMGTYQGLDKNNISFAGTEVRYGEKNWYVGAGGYVASNNFKEYYGLVDLKAKLNYDSKNIFEQNLRIRTAVDKDLKSTQIRYSPITVNIPVNKNVSIYSNTHYSGKYNYAENNWTHSLGNFTGVSCKIGSKDNIAFEAQRYNLQELKNNSPENWSINFTYTHSF